MDSVLKPEKPDEVIEKHDQVFNDQQDSVKSANATIAKDNFIEVIGNLKENKDYIVKARNFVDVNIDTPYKIKDFFKTNNLLVGETTNNLLVGENIDSVISVIKQQEDREASDAAYKKLVNPLTDHYKSEDMKKTKQYVDYGKDFNKKAQRELNIEMDKTNIKDEGYNLNKKEQLIEAAEEKRQNDLIEERSSEATDMPSIGVKLMPAIPLDVLNKSVDVGTVIDTFNGFQGLSLESIFKLSKDYSSAEKKKLDIALTKLKSKLPVGIEFTDKELKKSLLKNKLKIDDTIKELKLGQEQRLKENAVKRNNQRTKLIKERDESEKKLKEAIKNGDKPAIIKLKEDIKTLNIQLEEIKKKHEAETSSASAREDTKEWAETIYKDKIALQKHINKFFAENEDVKYEQYLFKKGDEDSIKEENEKRLEELINLEMVRRQGSIYEKKNKAKEDAEKGQIDVDEKIRISKDELIVLRGKLQAANGETERIKNAQKKKDINEEEIKKNQELLEENSVKIQKLEDQI